MVPDALFHKFASYFTSYFASYSVSPHHYLHLPVVLHRPHPPLQKLLRPPLLILSVLELNDDRAGFEAAEGVVLAHRDLDGRMGAGGQAAGGQSESTRLVPAIVEENLFGRPSQDCHRLAGPSVSMHPDHRPRLDRIQHPLAPVLRTVPQIVMHPEPRRLFRQLRKLVKQGFVNNHGLFHFRSVAANWLA